MNIKTTKNTRWGTKITLLSHRRVKAKCYLGQGSIRTASTTFTRACHKSHHDPNKTASNRNNPFLNERYLNKYLKNNLKNLFTSSPSKTDPMFHFSFEIRLVIL
jgi:hypothetical protein